MGSLLFQAAKTCGHSASLHQPRADLASEAVNAPVTTEASTDYLTYVRAKARQRNRAAHVVRNWNREILQQRRSYFQRRNLRNVRLNRDVCWIVNQKGAVRNMICIRAGLVFNVHWPETKVFRRHDAIVNSTLMV